MQQQMDRKYLKTHHYDSLVSSANGRKLTGQKLQHKLKEKMCISLMIVEHLINNKCFTFMRLDYESC